MTKEKSIKIYSIIGFIVAISILLIVLFAIYYKPAFNIEDILKAYNKNPKQSGLTVIYPQNNTIFPPEIVSPVFQWKDNNPESNIWLVMIEFCDSKESMRFLVERAAWEPMDKDWDIIKLRSKEKEAKFTILGVNRENPEKILSSGSVTIITSKDEVLDPIFYREVILPFSDAVKDPSRIQWRFGNISSKQKPPIVLDNLPVCGNCHSFSKDGSILGMDIDYANDKGSYVITDVSEDIVLSKDKIITWNDYKKEDKNITFGLLSQVSPDGKYVVSTVKDRSVFVAKPEIAFSQLFFPIKGILVVYSRETKSFKALQGASDPEFVQSNPAFSPDGKYIIFARSKSYKLKKIKNDKNALLTAEECEEFLKEGKQFLYDLYRIPFNEGKGGKAEPLKGASFNGMSNYFPKYSPDGKWVIFCKAKSYMLLQPDSELYIIPSEGGEPRKMKCNTNRMNSWHSWSSNSKWLVFSSKTNTPYTQLFLTHIDEHGNDSPPVLLHKFTGADRAANIPEFVNIKSDAIKRIKGQFIDDHSYWRAGEEYVRSHEYDSAVSAFKKALELNPKNEQVHTSLGFVLANKGKLDEAFSHLYEAIKINPNFSEAHNNLGLILKTQGKLDEAIYHFNEILRITPDSIPAHNNLGLILKMQENFDEAVHHFKEAIKINPDVNEANYNLALILQKQGKLNEAVFHFKESLRIKSNVAEVHYNLALTLEKQGKLDEALSHFKEITRIDPNVAEVYNNIGLILKNKGNLDEAISYFNEALKINPDYYEVHNNMGIVLQSQEKLPEAMVHFKEMLRINPNSIPAHNNIGMTLQRQGKLSEAIFHFKEMLRINPNVAEAHYNLAAILESQGKRDEAIYHFNEGLKINPDLEQAQNFRFGRH